MMRAGFRHGLPGVAMVVAILAGALHAEGPAAPERASVAASSTSSSVALSSGAVLDRYCVTCHN
jgi:hypothetical protein